MGRYSGPQCRLCRAEGTKLFLKGERCHTDKCAISRKRPAPGLGPRARMKKTSDYGVQLRQKQKVKRIYGMMEGQFRLFFSRATRMKGMTGENLLVLLERRLDNVLYRMRFASSRKQARQLVAHGLFAVNGRRVTIPSYLVRAEDTIEVHDKGRKHTAIKESLKEYTRSGVVPWLQVDPDAMRGKVLQLPRRNDLTDLGDVKEQLIVELYSK
jgi:small subunit ribosomal protein S4